MEYRESNIAFRMRSILESDTPPVSMALRGVNPQATVAKTIESKRG
jgi:hypothetical protein